MPSSTNRLKTTRLVGAMVDAYYDDLVAMRGGGKPVAWWIGFPMFPLLIAHDVKYVHGEGFAARAAGRHEEGPLQRAAEREGWSAEACSYARTHIGAAILAQKGVSAQGGAATLASMPQPNFMISCNPGCSTEAHWFDHLRRRFNIPGFHITVPHTWYGTPRDMEDATQAVVADLRDCVKFLEDMTGRAFDFARLKIVMAEAVRAATLRKESLLLCNAIPTPATVFDWAVSLAPVNILCGIPGTADYFTQLKEEIQERVGRGEGAVRNERYRLYYDGIMTWNRLGWLAETFAAYGAAVICSRYTHLGFFHRTDLLDPQKPLESLAASVAWAHHNQSQDTLVDWVSDLCQYYRVDGIIAANMRTCRVNAGVQLEIIDGVTRKLGIPAGTFDGDLTDENFFSPAQAETKIQALLENIEARRSSSLPPRRVGSLIS